MSDEFYELMKQTVIVLAHGHLAARGCPPAAGAHRP